MKKGVIIISCFLLVIMLAVSGCAKNEPQPAPKDATPEKVSYQGQSLNLYVAAGMKKPMDQVIDQFQKETGAKVVVNYGPSGGLYTQIDMGQPCDLYYSADWLYVDKLVKAGKTEKDIKFLQDNLVLVTSKTGASKIQSMNDLSKPGVTVVIADTAAPVGVYSKKALESLGLWDKVSPNIKAMPSTVNQVAIMVKEDQVDAGLIYSSVANGNELKAIEKIDTKYSGDIIFGAAIIKNAQSKLANAFFDFSSQHVDIFEQYGYKKYE